MSKKINRALIIVGTSELAQLACYYFRQDSDRKVAAFSVDRKFKSDDNCMGLPVICFEEVENHYPATDYDMFVAIGYSHLNKSRAKKCAEARAKGYRLASYFSSRASIWPGLVAGDNCFVMEGNVVQPFVEIGNSVIVWCNSLISHHVCIANNTFIAAHAVISGHAKIGENCFIGANATIRDKIEVAQNTIVGAGALILESTEENNVYLGNPSQKTGVPSHRFHTLL